MGLRHPVAFLHDLLQTPIPNSSRITPNATIQYRWSMTLAITTLTPSGIILTADSRQTYRNNVGMVRIGSDNVIKLFKLSDAVGVSIAGRAFIPDANGTPKNVGYFIEQFEKEPRNPTLTELTTKEIAQRLNDYLAGLFVDRERESLKARIATAVTDQGGTDLVFNAPVGNLQPFSFKDRTAQTKQETWYFETTELTVAGFDQDGIGRAYNVFVPSGITVEGNTQNCGALWIGQSDVISRILKGYEPAGTNLSFIKDAVNRDPVSTNEELAKLHYIINWASMTLQDAIDFNVLITRTTESIQRFSDGTLLAPGGVTGVGGDISVAAILPDRGFIWIKKRRLNAEGAVLNMD
jgi:hypothetical protein